ncbi:MAG: HAD family hydrolase [Gemmatimonadetes bacterium]|nr:HAD family hydrolase [Gemmatimonadota bacterium]
MKVALFDIDGTILLARGAGQRSMHRVLIEAIGTPGPGGQHYAGKTDPQIVREAMRFAGCDDREIDARMPAVLGRYLEELEQELRAPVQPIEVLPGVPELIDACEAHERVTLGLLTGNLLSGAAWKLRAGGIDPARFAFGAYGSDHEERPVLAGIARERASAHVGRDVAARDCVVIGDTPADIACAQAIGARTLAVATGSFTVDVLTEAGADHVMEDLADTASALAAILRD